MSDKSKYALIKCLNAIQQLALGIFRRTVNNMSETQTHTHTQLIKQTNKKPQL